MLKIAVCPKKVVKSVFVVADTPRMRSQMEGLRALGYDVTLSEGVGAVMTLLRDGERVNALVADLGSAKSTEKLIRWIKEHRNGVRVVCVLNAGLSDFERTAIALGARVLDESEIATLPEVLRNIIEPARPLG